MININDLKGIDFSKKYYDPSKDFEIINENFEFNLKVGEDFSDYQFKSDFHNEKAWSSDLCIFNILKDQIKIMRINKFKISLIKELFSSFENINFNELAFDLIKNCNILVNRLHLDKSENYDKLISCYKKVLSKYGISYTDETLDSLVNIFYKEEIEYKASCNYYDINVLTNESIENVNNPLFKLAYVIYLQLINSDHNNTMDVHHYFDNESIEEFFNYHTFYQIDATFPIDLIKKVAIKNNHIIDGNGIGILRYCSNKQDLIKVVEKYGLKKSGSKSSLIQRIEDNLSENTINKEFKGSRFILTSEGQKFLEKYVDYDFRYFQVLPKCFDAYELEILYKENPQYSIEDIIHAIVMNDWYEIENPKIFSFSRIDYLKFGINRNRCLLAYFFEKNFPEKAIEIYSSSIKNVFIKKYFDRLSKLYQKYNMHEEELEFLSQCIENRKKELEYYAPEFDDKKYDKYVKRILELTEEVIETNSDEFILNSLNKIKNKFEIVSGNSDDYLNYPSIGLMDEIEELWFVKKESVMISDSELEKISEISDLESKLYYMFYNPAYDTINQDIEFFQSQYDILSELLKKKC